MMGPRHVAHVYLGKSRDYAWCGRYVGFHRTLSAVTEERALEYAQTDRTLVLCQSCVRSIRAEGRRRPGSVGELPEAIVAALVRRREKFREIARHAGR